MTAVDPSTAVPALRGEARRQQILSVAEQLVRSEGVDALTMRRLAAEVGMQAPSLYKHWRDKSALVAALQERVLEEFGAAMQQTGGDLAALASAYRSWALANPALYELTTRLPLARDQLRPGLEAWAAAPVVAAVDGDEHRARALWAAAHGLVDLELADRFPPGADIPAAWDALVAAFARPPD